MHIDLSPYTSQKEFRKLAKAMRQAEKYFSEGTPSDQDAGFGVGANTFRAFRQVEKPSRIYRAWASTMRSSRRFKSAVLCASTHAEFESVHLWLSKHLAHYWKQESGTCLLLGHRYKLVDLFVKWLCRYPLTDSRMNRNLLDHGHVPLDSAVLETLDRLFCGVLLADGRAMGSIKTEQAYRFYQELVRSLMHELAAPPLYFDFFAWDLKRSRG